jgi:hypothetical protein
VSHPVLPRDLQRKRRLSRRQFGALLVTTNAFFYSRHRTGALATLRQPTIPSLLQATRTVPIVFEFMAACQLDLGTENGSFQVCILIEWRNNGVPCQ